MVYKFVFISDEVDDFMREISIDSDAKFIDLHRAILDSVGYTNDAITSFFICNDEWEKEQEVTLMEMDTSADVDNYVMDETTLSELIEDEDQKLLYVFDYVSDRAFFMQLKEIVPGQDLDAPQCTASVGEAPEQFKLEDIEEIVKPAKKGGKVPADDFIDESFYGDEGFDSEELDIDGFSDMDFDSDPNSL